MRSLILIAIVIVAALAFSRSVVVMETDRFPQAATVYEHPQPPTAREIQVIHNQRRPGRVDKRRSPENDVIWQGTVDGPPRASREEAWAVAIAKASDEIESALGLRLKIPDEEIKNNFVKDSQEQNVETGTSVAARSISLWLEVNANQARELARRERSYRVTERLAVLAKLLAILVAGLFAVAGCVRLDDWSKGYYSRTLKLLSLVAFAGAVLMVWKFAR